MSGRAITLAVTRLAVAAGCLLLPLGCGWQSDPATRLAYCVEDALKEQRADSPPTQATCNLEMSGSYLVVLHPAGALSDEQLVSAGVPQALLAEFRVLRVGSNPAMFVIATDPTVSGIGAARSTRSSRTTYQVNFVQIDTLMVLAKTSEPVSVEVRGAPERRVIQAIH